MHLKDVIAPDGEIVVVLVDEVQHVAVTEDFFLLPVLWRRLVLHQLLQTAICRDDALDPVGCLRALNLRDLDQALQFFRFLP